MIDWLVVSTHLKNISQIGNLPQIEVKIKNIWNHHLEKFSPTLVLLIFGFQWFQIKQLWRVFTTVFARVFPTDFQWIFAYGTTSWEIEMEEMCHEGPPFQLYQARNCWNPMFLKHFEGPFNTYIFRVSQTSWPEDACVFFKILSKLHQAVASNPYPSYHPIW